MMTVVVINKEKQRGEYMRGMQESREQILAERVGFRKESKRAKKFLGRGKLPGTSSFVTALPTVVGLARFRRGLLVFSHLAYLLINFHNTLIHIFMLLTSVETLIAPWF
jgi:hypothetical protein